MIIMIKRILAQGKFHELPQNIRDYLVERNCVPDKDMDVIGYYDIDESSGEKTGDCGFISLEERDEDEVHIELVWDDNLGVFRIPEDISKDDERAIFDMFGNLPFDKPGPNQTLQ